MTKPAPSSSAPSTGPIPVAPAPAAALPADALYLPDLWSFEPGVIYLNHGAFGAVPLLVRAEQRRWQDRFDANPMGYYRRSVAAELDRARLVVARFLGSDDEGVAFTQNATTGVATVLASLAFAPGDRILVTDHVYGAVLSNAQLVARRAGATIDVVHVPLEAQAADIVAAVMAEVRQDTRLAIIDEISSATAKLFPVAEIGRALRERGVRLLVDAAHSPGSIPVDLNAIGVDFWTGNLHKWAGAPRGTAGLYVAPELRADLASFPVSWRVSEGFPYALSNVGTVDQTGWLSAPCGLRFYEEFGWEPVRARNNALARRGQQLIAEEIGASLEGMPGEDAPDGYPLPMRLIPLATVPADEAACDALTERLALEHAIEVPVQAWNGRALLRVSAQLYNSEADYERLAQTLKQVL
jgi:isopenicillin-N epimerase